MWTALVLVWISSVPLSRSHTVSDEPRYLVTTKLWPKAVKQSMPRDTVPKAENVTTEGKATVLPVPVAATTETQAAILNTTTVTARVTTHWTNMGTPPAREGTTESVTSRTPAPPTPSGPSSGGQTLTITTAGFPPLSTPHTEVPRTNASASPGTATVAAVAPHTSTVAAGTMNTSGPPTRTPSPAKSTPTNTSTTSPIPTPGVQMQNTTVQVTTKQPVDSTVGRLTPTPSNTTLMPTTTHSVASVSPTVVTTTQVKTKEPTASTVPMPPTSPSPGMEATSPTTQPSPALPSQGTGRTGEPGTPLTTEQAGTKATAGTASTGPTPRSSGDLKVPATDSCQLSTQGQYLVVTTEPLTPSLVNKVLLLVVLVLGVALFIAVLVMFALQAYESHKQKDYTQVDYLINGMYADSEM
ncbi:uncharacterized protein C11orf24 homolog [Meriones unguiculatus]|uniref:uncharacterized protein C11orf24 homolog n=1 Tax=Meriones unguiculatus TaxID=10047 RepID=UPI000B4FCD15|nr:uncharacterized protein C11orf24 homolog [Meriones unguiculatus]XP_021490028.1 uncharacterized protein C11orf24 homolog [Meriones unguiculatus]XP_021490035.1 uncharacterized protein C11orf24 homolog [Meriones unguiculatus]